MPDYSREQIDEQIDNDPEMIALVQNGDENEFNRKHAEIYREFNLDPMGQPLRLAQRAIKGVSKATGIPEGVVQGAAALPLPTVGTIAGGIAGSPGGPVGATIGAMGGSVLGEAGNSLLGITEPMGATEFGLAAAGPLVAPAIAKAAPGAIKAAKRLLPGMGAGLNELAGEQFAAKLNSMRVTREMVDQASDALSMTHGNFKIPTENLRKSFIDESARIGEESLRGVPTSKGYQDELAKFVQDNFPQNAKSMSFKDLMVVERGLNRIKGDRPGEIWAKASGVLIDEMEKAIENPALSAVTRQRATQGLNTFKQFIATNRKYNADEELTRLLSSKGVLKASSGDPNLVQIDQKMLRRGLDENKALNRAYSKAEIKEMKDAILDLGYISKPPQGGQDAVNLAKRYGAGGMIGWMAGGPMGALAGAGVEEIIRKGITSPKGREIVKYMAKQGRGHINAMELDQMLGKAVGGMSAGLVPGVTGAGSPEGIKPFAEEQ